MRNSKAIIAAVFTVLLLAAAIGLRLFQINMASRVTIRPATVEQTQVSPTLTDVEKKYVTEFIKKIQKDYDYEAESYVSTRNTDSSVEIQVYFKGTDDVGYVTYDPVSDRWRGEMVVSE